MAFIARIYVTPRADVLDPQGNAVGRALVSLGFDGVSDVSIGRYLELQIASPSRDEASKTVESMCEALLANLVVEDYRYELETLAGS